MGFLSFLKKDDKKHLSIGQNDINTKTMSSDNSHRTTKIKNACSSYVNLLLSTIVKSITCGMKIKNMKKCVKKYTEEGINHALDFETKLQGIIFHSFLQNKTKELR